MENTARAIIAAPWLTIPLVVAVVIALLVEAPQVLIVITLVVWWRIHRYRRKHRFDTYVSGVLK